MSKQRTDVSLSPFRDLAGFVLLAVAAFVLISLATYNSLDPSWNTEVRGPGVVVQNYGGLVGSYLGDFLMMLFGYASYFIPIALFGLTWYVVFLPTLKGMSLRVTGFCILVISVTLLLTLFAGDTPRVPSWGGMVGYLLGGYLVNYGGAVGAYLVAGTALAAALVLAVGFTFHGFLKNLSLLYGIPNQVQAALTDPKSKFRRWIREFLELGEKEFRKGMDSIRADAEPQLEANKKLKIAGQEVVEDDKDSLAEAPAATVIPIVFPKKEVVKELPKFHTQEDDQVTIRTKRSYLLPDATLLDADVSDLMVDRDELFRNAQTLELKLKDFGVFGKVVEVQPGPVVTMYEFEPAPGVKVNQIMRLNDDLALALKAHSVRIAVLPGKAVIGIEVANQNRQVVYLKEIIVDDTFRNISSKLSMALGKDISGIPFTADLRKMPHLLVAGATGSGKSVSVNSMILSVLYKATPDEVRMILVDPKMLELSLYDGIPHLLLPVVTDPRKAAAALRWAVIEMERRYRLMADIGVRNIEGYNRKIPKVLESGEFEKAREDSEIELPIEPGATSDKTKPEEHKGPLPYVMIVIDELADLMMVSSREVEESIIRLAQMARAAGIHLLLATQRPSVDVITGVIKANMPARISFQVSSKTDSRTILDANGAELLLGAGDMLFIPPGTSKLIRIHGAFVTDNEVKRVTDFWKKQGNPDYDHEILKVQMEQEQLMSSSGDEEEDQLYRSALELVKTHRVASISMIQRKLRIGYNRAARLVERMDEEGYLSPGEVGKPREVRITRFETI